MVNSDTRRYYMANAAATFLLVVIGCLAKFNIFPMAAIFYYLLLLGIVSFIYYLYFKDANYGYTRYTGKAALAVAMCRSILFFWMASYLFILNNTDTYLETGYFIGIFIIIIITAMLAKVYSNKENSKRF